MIQVGREASSLWLCWSSRLEFLFNDYNSIITSPTIGLQWQSWIKGANKHQLCQNSMVIQCNKTCFVSTKGIEVLFCSQNKKLWSFFQLDPTSFQQKSIDKNLYSHASPSPLWRSIGRNDCSLARARASIKNEASGWTLHFVVVTVADAVMVKSFVQPKMVVYSIDFLITYKNCFIRSCHGQNLDNRFIGGNFDRILRIFFGWLIMVNFVFVQNSRSKIFQFCSNFGHRVQILPTFWSH